MIGQHTLNYLANEKGEDVNDYMPRPVLLRQEGLIDEIWFIDTGGHGYLVLGSDNLGYSDAVEVARSSNYSYILNTLVYLEEDCDIDKFLKLGSYKY